MSMPAFRRIGRLAATAGHIDTVQATLDRLNAVKRESWEQLLTTVSRMYRAGELTPEELLELQLEMRSSFGTGYGKVWDSVMPVPCQKVRHIVERRRRNTPNGPLGSWFGTFPIETQPAPTQGESVVYVLFDEYNEPCYVGSTEVFRTRMADHRASKPGLRSWTAYPCRDRDHAYELEVQLLNEHKPRMNKRRGR